MAENPNITFLWKIENIYFSTQKNGESLDSPEFYVNALSESSWKLRIYPYCEADEDEVKVHLHNNYYNGNNILFIDYEISFLSADGSVVVTGKERNKKINADNSYAISTYPTNNEVMVTRQMEFRPEGTLTVQCRIWKTKKSLVHSTQYFARTRIGIQRRSFHWAVAEFSRLKLNGSRRIHRIIGGENQPIFSMELYLKGTSDSYASVGIDIKQVAKNIPELFSTLEVSVLDAAGNIVRSVDDNFWLEPGDTFSFKRFLTKHKLSQKTEWLAGDVLNLLCNFTFSTDVEYSNIESVSSVPPWIRITTDDDSDTEEVSASVENNIQESDQRFVNAIDVSDQSSDESAASLQLDLLSLYKDKPLSDFELRVGYDSFAVHKCVLIARSPVFKAMFSSDMIEGSCAFLDIPDVEPGTLDRLLKFIYTGTVADLEIENASMLYYAADKYEILSLKKKCSEFLESNIADSNVCEILLLADRHNDEGLKSSVHQFIVQNDSKIIPSTEWKRFLVSNPLLAAETMQLIYSKKLGMQKK